MNPVITYEIKQLHWKCGRDDHRTFKLPASAHFVPQDYCSAAVLWQNNDLSLIPIEKLDPALTGKPLELASIQYEIHLQYAGKEFKARLMHEFIGTGKQSTHLTDSGQMIQNRAVLFEEFKVEDVFEEAPLACAKYKVVQFVS